MTIPVSICVCQWVRVRVSVCFFVSSCKFLPFCPFRVFTFSSLTPFGPPAPAVSELLMATIVHSMQAVQLLHLLQLLLLLHFSGDLSDPEVLLELNLETPKKQMKKRPRAGVLHFWSYICQRWPVGRYPAGAFYLSLQSKVSFICASVQQLLMYKVTFPLLISGICLAESPVALSFIYYL